MQLQNEIQKRHNVSIYFSKYKIGTQTELYADVYNGRHTSKKRAQLSGQGEAVRVGHTVVHYSYFAETAMGKAKNELLNEIDEALTNLNR